MKANIKWTYKLPTTLHKGGGLGCGACSGVQGSRLEGLGSCFGVGGPGVSGWGPGEDLRDLGHALTPIKTLTYAQDHLAIFRVRPTSIGPITNNPHPKSLNQRRYLRLLEPITYLLIGCVND